MNCPYCGRATVEGALFCGNCGKPLPADETTPEPLGTQPPEANARLDSITSEIADDAEKGNETFREELKSQGGTMPKKAVSGEQAAVADLPHLNVLAALKRVFESRGKGSKFVVPLSKEVSSEASTAAMNFRSFEPEEKPLALFGKPKKNGSYFGMLVTDSFVRWRLREERARKMTEGRIAHSEIGNIGFVEIPWYKAPSCTEKLLAVNDKPVGVFAIEGTVVKYFTAATEACKDAATEFCKLVSERPPVVDGLVPELPPAVEVCEDNPHSVEWLFNGNIGEKLPRAYFTYAVAGLCILMYLVQWMMGAGPFDSDWALVRVARSLGGEVPVWGHLVRGFMHGGIIHLGMNMLVLLTSCASVERTWGTKLYAAVYLACVFCGGVCSAMLQPDATAVGASGGIFGIMGAICSFGFIRYCSMAKRLSGIDQQRVFRWIKGYGSLLMGNLYITAKLGRYGGISIGGHLGGLLAGLALGFVALLLVPPRRDFSEKSENGETPDKPSGGGAAAKDKVLASAGWCREKIVALWQSGIKGKAVCIAAIAVPAVWLLPRWLLVGLVLGAVAVLFFRSRRSEKTESGETPDKPS